MVEKHNTFGKLIVSDTAQASGNTKMNRNDAYPAFNGAGRDGILERVGKQILQGNVRRPTTEANSTCCVAARGIEQGAGGTRRQKQPSKIQNN